MGEKKSYDVDISKITGNPGEILYGVIGSKLTIPKISGDKLIECVYAVVPKEGQLAELELLAENVTCGSINEQFANNTLNWVNAKTEEIKWLRSLLKKYINVVAENEGVTFIEDDGRFTKDEYNHLIELQSEQ